MRQLTRECAARSAGRVILSIALCIAFFTIAAFTGMDLARADTDYYRHTFFDNSITSDDYFYSSGKVSTPSSLLLKDGKLPVDTKTFFTPPNALRLEWQSTKGGGWDAEIRVVNFRNREINFAGDTLYLWCFANQEIAAQDLPLIRLLDNGRNFSAPLKLGAFSGAVTSRPVFPNRLG